MTPDDSMRLVSHWNPYLPKPTMPVPITTSDSTDVMGVSYTYTYSVEPGFSVGYSQKDIDEAYCRGYNEGLKVHGNGETTLDGSKSITLVFGICKQCGHYTPYACYCLNCGAKIRYGDDV